jgi:hypothetical protein
MNWKFVGSCADGEEFEIQGINVWSCEWVQAKSEVAEVRDPLYKQLRKFSVYDLVQGESKVRVAAGEFSNCIWGFYVAEQP